MTDYRNYWPISTSYRLIIKDFQTNVSVSKIQRWKLLYLDGQIKEPVRLFFRFSFLRPGKTNRTIWPNIQSTFWWKVLFGPIIQAHTYLAAKWVTKNGSNLIFYPTQNQNAAFWWSDLFSPLTLPLNKHRLSKNNWNLLKILGFSLKVDC